MSSRKIDRNIFTDETIGQATPIQRLLWIGLFTVCADDQGRLLDNPAVIRALIFPYDDITLDDIKAGLKFFADKGRIIRYTAGTNGSAKDCIQLAKWWDHQKGYYAIDSKLPAPDGWADRINYRDSKGRFHTKNWKPEAPEEKPIQPPLAASSPLDTEAQPVTVTATDATTETAPAPVTDTALYKTHDSRLMTHDSIIKESEEIESSSSSISDDGEGDSLSKQKTLICQLAGVLKKNREQIIKSPSLIPDDLLAELARNYARHKRDPHEVKNPGAVTGMNLVRGEHAPIEWYEPHNWLNHIPRKLLEVARPDLLREVPEIENTQQDSDYTKFIDDEETNDPAMDIPVGRYSPNQAWAAIIEQFKREHISSTLLDACKLAHPASFDGESLMISTRNQDDCELLESRLTSTLERIFPAFFDHRVAVRFTIQDQNVT